VQSARESARSSMCANKLKQMALAVLQHEGAPFGSIHKAP
jgi:hypothetical protein